MLSSLVLVFEGVSIWRFMGFKVSDLCRSRIWGLGCRGAGFLLMP